MPTRLTEALKGNAGRDNDAGLRPAKDVVSRRLGDEIVLVNLRTDLIYKLNHTGAELWALLERGCGHAELSRQMLERFDVPEDTLQDEIDVLISALREKGLVTATGA